jgi:hypothetical protein
MMARAGDSDPRAAAPWSRYAEPALIAQLLAARLDLPQSRRWRRAEPETATTAYAATRNFAAPAAAGRLRRFA